MHFHPAREISWQNQQTRSGGLTVSWSSGTRIRDASLSRITAPRFAPSYKCIRPFLLSIKFSTEMVWSIFSIFGVIFKKSMDFFKFKRSIRPSVFRRHFRKCSFLGWLKCIGPFCRAKDFVEKYMVQNNSERSDTKKIDMHLRAHLWRCWIHICNKHFCHSWLKTYFIT